MGNGPLGCFSLFPFFFFLLSVFPFLPLWRQSPLPGWGMQNRAVTCSEFLLGAWGAPGGSPKDAVPCGMCRSRLVAVTIGTLQWCTSGRVPFPWLGYEWRLLPACSCPDLSAHAGRGARYLRACQASCSHATLALGLPAGSLPPYLFGRERMTLIASI